MTEQYCMNLTHDDPPTEHLTYSYILCVNWAHAAASLALNVLLMYRTLPLSPVSSFLMWLTRPKCSLRWRFVIKKPRQCMKKQVQALCSWIFSSDSVQQVVGIFFPEFISNALQVLDYVNAFLAPVRLLLISNFFFTCFDKWDFLKRFCVYVDQSMESTVLFKADTRTQTSGFCSLNTYSSKDELEGWTCVCSEV